MESYLDNSATTKPCKAAVEAVAEAMTTTFGNPSSLHSHGFAALKLLEASRAAVAKSLSAEPREIYFTPSGTVANNTAIFGAVMQNRRAGNRVVLGCALFFALQPIELAYFIGGLLNPQLQPLNLGSDELFMSIIPAQSGGSWLDVAWAGLRYGLPVNFTWAIEHGRFTQTLFLFLLGLWLGRRRLFYDEGGNAVVWRRTMMWSLAAFAVLCPLRYTVPQLFAQECAQASLTVMLDMWKNLAMMLFYVSALTWMYHRTRARRLLAKLLPYGKMSLSNYIGQSVVGGFVFYHWGLGLYTVSGHTMSLVLGVALPSCSCNTRSAAYGCVTISAGRSNSCGTMPRGRAHAGRRNDFPS